MTDSALFKTFARAPLAFERGEAYPGIACVAAAVRGPQGPVAAVSLVGGMQTPLNRVAPLVVDDPADVPVGTNEFGINREHRSRLRRLNATLYVRQESREVRPDLGRPGLAAVFLLLAIQWPGGLGVGERPAGARGPGIISQAG